MKRCYETVDVIQLMLQETGEESETVVVARKQIHSSWFNNHSSATTERYNLVPSPPQLLSL